MGIDCTKTSLLNLYHFLRVTHRRPGDERIQGAHENGKLKSGAVAGAGPNQLGCELVTTTSPGRVTRANSDSTPQSFKSPIDENQQGRKFVQTRTIPASATSTAERESKGERGSLWGRERLHIGSSSLNVNYKRKNCKERKEIFHCT